MAVLNKHHQISTSAV